MSLTPCASSTSLEARPVQPRDFLIIKNRVERDLARASRRGGKDWTKLIKADRVTHYLINADNVFIVDDAYVVAYSIDVPWWGVDPVLSELVVIRLAPGDFSKVPAFLESEARRYGVTLVMTGTALAISDRALAHMYSKAGFNQQAISMGKPITQGV